MPKNYSNHLKSKILLVFHHFKRQQAWYRRTQNDLTLLDIWYFLYQMKVQTLIEKFIGLVSPQMPYGQPKLWLLSFSCLLFFIPFLIKLFLKQGYMAYKSWHNEIGLFPHILTLLVINLMIFMKLLF